MKIIYEHVTEPGKTKVYDIEESFRDVFLRQRLGIALTTFTQETWQQFILDRFQLGYERGVVLQYKVVEAPNVYGSTELYTNGVPEIIADGFGFKDENGHITWFDGYDPPCDDEFHLTTITGI